MVSRWQSSHIVSCMMAFSYLCIHICGDTLLYITSMTTHTLKRKRTRIESDLLNFSRQSTLLFNQPNAIFYALMLSLHPPPTFNLSYTRVMFPEDEQGLHHAEIRALLVLYITSVLRDPYGTTSILRIVCPPTPSPPQTHTCTQSRS